MENNWFEILRNTAFIFSTAMLIKYFIFLILAPFNKVKETIREIKTLKKEIASRKVYKPLVSVIIPAWNEEVGVLTSVKSLLANTYEKIEIIIVNDGSTDNTDEVVKSFIKENGKKISGKKLVYFYKENGGKGTALNYGIERAYGEIIVTMDADSAFEKDAIENMVEYFKDPKVSALVGNVKVANNYSIVGIVQKIEYLFGFYFKKTHSLFDAEYIFGGACAAFRKSTVFDNLGLFDTSNKTEDIEMSMRIKSAGLSSVYGNNVICYTEGASTVEGLIKQRLRWKKGRFDTFLKYRNMFFSTKKNHNKFLSWVILPFTLVAEFQLLLEPLSFTLLFTYSVISGEYVSLTLGLLFIGVLYIVNAFFNEEKVSPLFVLLFPATWVGFYFLVWIEYIALIKGAFMVLRGEDVVWQKWNRLGVKTK